ncbi:MAG: GMC family oxidoreductase N-terminal domain-containing protein, partial [Chloroflexi bacterium]|nr:GMC family oxidoreductase N-terminal domain-containing protein [Chloroflexota bacterium]
MHFDGERERRRVDEAFDYVIVGSGAAGATVARVLADTGASIAIVEEGPAVDTSEFTDKVYPSMRHLYREMSMQTARGRALIPILQGRCLGGSTVINSGIIWRIPDDVWEPWRSTFGLGDALPLDALHQNWDVIERELSVQPTPRAVWGENNRLMDVARKMLNLSGGAIHRNVHDCRGSARCQLGCPFGAKQSMLVSYLPYAQRKGAALFT